MEIGQIIKGHANELLGLNKNISAERKKICYSCPLYSPKFGGLCNNNLWINTDTGEISSIKKEGYKQGCGCRINAKTTIFEAKCPIGKW